MKGFPGWKEPITHMLDGKLELQATERERRRPSSKREGETYILELIDLPAPAIRALRNAPLLRESARKTFNRPLQQRQVDAPRRRGEAAQARDCFFRW